MPQYGEDMCRLFGLHTGAGRVHVSYWLVDAPDSIATESRRNPDGAGIGWDDGTSDPHVVKWAQPAYESEGFAHEALGVTAFGVVTHIRAATAGEPSPENTHPFLVSGRALAHNGGFGDLPAIEAQLGGYRRLVHGDTDSERFAALVAMETDTHDGDVTQGISAAAQWIARHLPMYSLNIVVLGAGNLWALRYPDTRALHVGTRLIDPATGGDAGWQGRSVRATHKVSAASSDPVEAVVISQRAHRRLRQVAHAGSGRTASHRAGSPDDVDGGRRGSPRPVPPARGSGPQRRQFLTLGR